MNKNKELSFEESLKELENRGLTRAKKWKD